VISAPVWLLAFVYFLFLSLVIAIWAGLGNFSALISFIFLSLSLIIIRQKTRMIIEINAGQLRIGRAHIELKYLSDAQILTAKEMGLARGRNGDPAAFLAIRFWTPTGVKVLLNDSRDSTPYWLITSKNCAKLAKALTEN